MPPNRFESEVESFLEGSHGDRTHIKRADHHTVTPLCGTLLRSADKIGVGVPTTRTSAQGRGDTWVTGQNVLVAARPQASSRVVSLG